MRDKKIEGKPCSSFLALKIKENILQCQNPHIKPNLAMLPHLGAQKQFFGADALCVLLCLITYFISFARRLRPQHFYELFTRLQILHLPPSSIPAVLCQPHPVLG